MKKLVVILSLLVFALSLWGCFSEHYDESNISQLYDKEWIVGKSRDQIVEKYGEFDREFISDSGEDLGAWYVNYDNDGMDPSYIHDTYFVVFNDQDVAVDAYFRQTSIGG